MASVVDEFENGGFWHCRTLNKWMLVIVTLAFGIALGADVLYELLTSSEFPWALGVAGLLSLICVILLWICVTYAAAAGAVILVLALFVDGIAYSVLLAVLLTGLTAMTATRTFRRVTLGIMVLWAALLGAGMDQPSAGLGTFVAVSVLLLGAYGLGGAFRNATNARLQSKQDLEEAEERHRESVTAERESIARDLHDIVAHDMTIIAMQSRAAQLENTPESYREAVRVIGDSSRAALQDLRRMLALLNPDQGEDLGSPGSATELDVRHGLRVFCQRLEKLGIAVEQQVTGDVDSLSRSVNAALYRILQECTTNIAKYAGEGAHCRVQLSIAEQVDLTVTNTIVEDRVGAQWSSSGAGLIGVRDRASAFGGEATHGIDADGNWRVEITGMKRA
ncbi:sensor histidine kinase [Nesterenkonia alba]|uniref:sensor histidine kinase n=1 Tax=Nesterenkonia alba TaxID=515814 RepID=UPI0003B315C4|nr:histidine kinase [Nesterenkonia alba]